MSFLIFCVAVPRCAEYNDNRTRKGAETALNITVKNEYRVEAEISADEMELLGIRFSELDYSSPETRMFLWSIIEEMRGEGIDIDMSGKVLIEAFDNGTGGSVIAFTMLPADASGGCVKQLVKNISDTALVMSDGLDGLINFSRAVGDVRSELYYFEKHYCLFVFPRDAERERLSRVLPEFFGTCSASAKIKLAECREKGNPVRVNDAIHMLSML